MSKRNRSYKFGDRVRVRSDYHCKGHPWRASDTATVLVRTLNTDYYPGAEFMDYMLLFDCGKREPFAAWELELST